MKSLRRPSFALVTKLHLVTLLALFASFSAFCPSVSRAADLSITAGSVLPSASAKIVSGTAGATITAGQLVYLDTTANTYKLADANGATPLYKVAGLAILGASSGQRVYVCIEDPAFTLGATLVIGDTVWASATPGGMTKVAAEGVATGNFVSVVGVAISPTKINFKIIRADAVTP